MGESTTLDLDLFYSTLGGDPDLADLVELFVEEIPDRVARMRECLDQGDAEGLRRAAHQLKGAAGSYGFMQLTPALQKLEMLAKEEAAADERLKALKDVAAMCSRVRAGEP